MSIESTVLMDMDAPVETSVTMQEYLVFISDELRYVVSAANVIEIITNLSITHMPKVPDYIKGIINLRGQVIPIIDIRLRMYRSPVEYDEECCIIVINMNDVFVGLLVEKVSHVVNIDEENISQPPANKKQELVSGIVNLDNDVYLILDCEKLIQF
ncbi:MAG: chemotaxis protein CheW [Oscillospiraceae bacterium]|nr:chemotaxis protein CheW [Oscillospiraceae bacterium]